MSLCQYLDVKENTTTAYHRQANGQVEHYNRALFRDMDCISPKASIAETYLYNFHFRLQL